MTTPDVVGVVIPLPQIYAELRALGETLGRVEGTVTTVAADVQVIRTTQTDQETRVRALESLRWPLGSVAALAGVGGVVVAAWALLAQ